ncbi:MAG: MATE family efflux transporter [Minwuia sp.]|uniref:MATE family efflux transporter n=1 Tax=Minwuia sp. TaxID=2493630 RepID=UPI003A8BC19F
MTRAQIRRQAILSGPIWPVLARMAAPGIAAMMIMSMMSIVETWFLGRIGTGALASVALVFPVFMLTNMLSAGSVGGVISGATANMTGAGDEGGAEAVLRTGTLMASVCGLAMAGFFWLAGPSFYRLLGGEDAVLEGALTYSSILMIAIPLMWQFNMLAGVLRGSGDMSTPAVIQGLVTLGHFGFCWLFIQRLDLGIAGAGYAVLAAFRPASVCCWRCSCPAAAPWPSGADRFRRRCSSRSAASPSLPGSRRC